MKLRHTLIVGCLTALLGVGAFVGANISKDAKVEKVEAANYRSQDYWTAGDEIYIQAYSPWTGGDPHGAKFSLYLFADGVSAVWSSYITVGNNRVSNGWYSSTYYDVLYYKLEAKFTGHYTTAIVVRFDADRTDDPSWDNTWGKTNDVNINDKTKNAIYLKRESVAASDAGTYAYDDFYKLSIGGQTSIMYYNYSDSTEKREATITGVTAGQSVSITKGIGSTAQTISPESNYANNITSSKTVKAGGSVTIYYRLDNNSTWASGYGTNETGLENFCNVLLTKSISAGTCSVPTGANYTDIINAWNGTDASAKSAFRDATPKEGQDFTYSSVIQEALTRYVYLYKLGMANFADVSAAKLSAPKAGFKLSNNSNENNIAIIGLVSLVSLIAVGGFFFLKKKKTF